MRERDSCVALTKRKRAARRSIFSMATDKRQLHLNEALLTINKSSVAGELDVYYQIEQCIGCPLEKLTKLGSQLEYFSIETKHKFLLELRNNSAVICQFTGLEFNDNGHYQLDLKRNTSNRIHNIQDLYECSIQTLDRGNCYLCPIALLVSLVLVLSFAESIYSRFASKQRGSGKREYFEDGESVQTGSETGRIGTVSSNDANQQVCNTMMEENIIDSEREISGENRIDSLDIFRGFTLASMIMVNYGGAGYLFLEHSLWNGLTLGDFVFPFFIFSMGVSVAISIKLLVNSRGKCCLLVMKKVVTRAIVLMLIGLCLNSNTLKTIGGDLSHLRLTGVLQRLSISYLVVASMFTLELNLSNWIKARNFSTHRVSVLVKLSKITCELLVALTSLTLYLYMTFFFEFSPDCPAGYIGPGGQSDGGRYFNCTGGAAAWLDRVVLGENHLYRDSELQFVFKTNQTHDPEGILGYTTSILLTLIGLQCGKIFLYIKNPKMRLMMFAQWTGLLALTCVAVIRIPINKKLWSLTFVSLTGASAFLLLGALYLLIDVYRCKRTFFLRLLQSAGKNSIFLYVGHSIIQHMLPWYFGVDENSHLQLLMRLTWSTFVWLLVAHYMASKKVIIRV